MSTVFKGIFDTRWQYNIMSNTVPRSLIDCDVLADIAKFFD